MFLDAYPGMAHALARMRKVEALERGLRTLAMTPLLERINGLEVRQLTPRHMDLLILVRSPFLHRRAARQQYGLFADAEDVAQFLWIVSPRNPLDGSPPPVDFCTGLRPEEPAYFQKFYRAIDRYYDRATIDEPRGGGSGRPVPTALSVSMVNRIAGAYGWLPEVLDRKGRPIPGKGILDMPIARLNQYLMWIRMERDPHLTAIGKLARRARDMKHAVIARWHAKAEAAGVSVEECVKLQGSHASGAASGGAN
jgi:hypothetical protein